MINFLIYHSFSFIVYGLQYFLCIILNIIINVVLIFKKCFKNILFEHDIQHLLPIKKKSYINFLLLIFIFFFLN